MLLAQTAPPPVRLGPRRPSQPEAPAAGPATQAPEQGPERGPEQGTSKAGPVDVQTLSEVDPDSVGVLDDPQGGLGIDMWKDADRNVVVRLLRMLPHSVHSRVLRDLMRRLLLTRATAPKDAGEGMKPAGTGQSDDAAPRSLLGLRVDGLFAIGDLDGALRLLRTTVPERAGERLVQREVEGLFFANDNAGACKRVRDQAQTFQGSYWQQAVAYCLALAGENAKAALVSEILAERGAEVAPAFFTLMEAITGARSVAVASLKDPLALHISMMRAANQRLPDDVVASNRPIVLRAVALSPNADFALRLGAAEGAFAAGALGIDQLMEIYASVPFEPGELSSPLSAAEAAWGPRGRALLIRAAAQQEVPTARAEVLQRAFQLGREKGGGAIVMAAAVPLLAQVKPAGELIWFAGDAARTLFAAGRTEEALAWYALVRQEAASNPDAAAAATALWPLAALAGDADAAADASFIRWWATQPKGSEGAGRAQRLAALLDACGIKLGVAAWAAVLNDAPAAGPVPGAAIRHLLAQSAAEGRRGEAATLALVAMGDRGVTASTLAVDGATRAIKAIGLEKEARALAVEAAVAAGL
jgi:hypothetical protein